MPLRIAINGFGRIGRMVFRKAIHEEDVEVVAVNASYPAETLAHLVKYDTIHGTVEDEIRADGDRLIVNGKEVKLVSNRDPAGLPWGISISTLWWKPPGNFAIGKARGFICKREPKRW